jgi:phage tail-like protein
VKTKEIEGLLPVVFQRTARPGSPLYALLGVMAEFVTHAEQFIAHVDEKFDPSRTPDRFVPYLAGWVDLDHLFDDAFFRAQARGTLRVPISSSMHALRLLIANAHYLSGVRGTKKGLVHFLEIATAAAGFEVEEDLSDERGRRIPFHIRVQAPPGVKRYRDLIERIIESEKPAYVTYELRFL